MTDPIPAVEALARYHRAYLVVHSSYDGECEHGFGPPATKCPNDDCPDRELAEAWNALTALTPAQPVTETTDLRAALPSGDELTILPKMRLDAHEFDAFRPGDVLALLNIIDRMDRAIRAALARQATPASGGLDGLAEAVSDALAASTEGTDYAEAPEPSDEPGSPYVMRLTSELALRGVARLTSEATS